jgi:hypothetical protein
VFKIQLFVAVFVGSLGTAVAAADQPTVKNAAVYLYDASNDAGANCAALAPTPTPTPLSAIVDLEAKRSKIAGSIRTSPSPTSSAKPVAKLDRLADQQFEDLSKVLQDRLTALGYTTSAPTKVVGDVISADVLYPATRPASNLDVVIAGACSNAGVTQWTLRGFRVSPGSRLQPLGQSVGPYGVVQSLASIATAVSEPIAYAQVYGDNADYVNAQLQTDEALRLAAIASPQPMSVACSAVTSHIAVQGVYAEMSNTTFKNAAAAALLTFKQPSPWGTYYSIAGEALGALGFPYSSWIYFNVYDCAGDRVWQYTISGRGRGVGILDNKSIQTHVIQHSVDDLRRRMACQISAIRYRRAREALQPGTYTNDISESDVQRLAACSNDTYRYHAPDLAPPLPVPTPPATSGVLTGP